MYRFIVPALLLLGGSAALSDTGSYAAKQAARDRIDLNRQLAGLVPGKPQDCIDQTRFYDSTRVGDTILYKQGRSEIYRNDTSGGCFGLRQGDAIVTKSYSGRICRGDIVQTINPTSRIPSGSCTFGDFVPYRRP